MQRHLILGTAGHIDHGKTSLVRALTGIDTDRLPEEKARGITIDIGFAELELGDIRVGIVDVPGHERFIHNMLAGATGIDLAVLVIAADDSVMPQTREHFEILKLLGVKHGVIALTKCDLADEITREVAELEIRELVQGSFLEAAPIIATSITTLSGVAELKDAIAALSRAVVDTTRREPFRLPIDRSFVLQGHGTIITGSVLSGSVRVGDMLEWHRGDGTTESIRVRSLNNHGRSVEELRRGMRGAVNLAGVPHEQVRRGQELATPGSLVPSRVLTVKLTTIGDAVREIKHRLPLRLHLGTAEVMAKASLLQSDTLPRGETTLAQLFLEEPVTGVHGQPFVVRDASAEHTLGGGVILQPTARKLRRRHAESVNWLERLTGPDCAEAAAWFAGFAGLEPHELTRTAGIAPDVCDECVQQLLAARKVVKLTKLIHAERILELKSRILARLAVLHAEQPLLTNHDRGAALAELADIESTLLHEMIERMLKEKTLVGTSRRIAWADFKPKLSAKQRDLKDQIVAAHAAAGFAPPEPGSFANHAGGSTKGLVEIFEVAVAEGLLVKVAEGIYLHADTAGQMIAKVRALLAKGGATVADIRNELGTTRKYAVPICEYLDRAGITRREGDLRVLV